MKNFDETDTDCGGSCRDVRKCQLAERCAEDADCFNNVCAVAFTPPVRACLECRIDSDCDGLGSPLSFRCFNNFCFECAINSDCPRPGQPAAQQFCVEPIAGVCPPGQPCSCRQCRESSDCATDQICDEEGACFGGCTTNEDCPSGVACVDSACTGTCLPLEAACTDADENTCETCCSEVFCCSLATCKCCDFGESFGGGTCSARCG